MTLTITEDKVRNYLRDIPKDTPEEKARKLTAVRQWSAERKLVRFNNEETRMSGIFRDPETHGGEWTTEQQRLADLTFSPRETKYESANLKWIAHMEGKTVNEIAPFYATYRDAYAKKYFGDIEATNEAFFNQVKGIYEIRQRQEDGLGDLGSQTVLQMLEARTQGKPWRYSPTFANWSTGQKSLGLDREKEGEYLAGAFKYQRKVMSDIEPYADDAAKGYDILRRQVEGKANEVEARNYVLSLSKKPAEYQEAVLTYIYTAGQAAHKDEGGFKQLWGNFTKVVGRSFSFFAKGDLLDEQIRNLRELKHLEDGKPWWAATDGHYRALEGMGMDPAYNPEMGYERSQRDYFAEITPEERKQMIAERKELVPVFGLIRKMNQVRDTGIQPINMLAKDPWSVAGMAEQSLYAIGGSTGVMTATSLAILHPLVGFAAGSYALTGVEADAIMTENPNMDPVAALNIASASAMIQTALNMFQLKSLSGRLSMGVKALEQMPASWKKFAIASGIGWGEQSIEEVAQNFVSIAVPAAASYMRDDMKNADLGEAWRDLGHQSAIGVFSSIPFGMVAGGMALPRDFKDGGRFVFSKEGLSLAGFSEKQSTRIRSEAAKGEESGVKAYREEWKNRKPENIKTANEKLSAMMKAAEANAKDPNAPQIRVRQSQDGREWIVSDGDGTELLKTPSRDQAMLVLEEARGAQMDMQQSGVMALIEHLSATVGTEFRVTPIKRMTADEIAVGELSLEQLAEYVNIKGMEGDPLEMRVLGKTTVKELQNEGRRVIAEIFAGANPRTVIEEGVEVHLSNALNEGRITEDWLREQIAAWDAVHPEDALLKTGSRQNLIEAVSTLGKAYFANKVKARALPPGLAKFFLQLAAMFEQFFVRAAKLKESFADGTLSPEFKAMLEGSLGFGGKGDPAPSGSSSRDFLAAGDLLSNSFSLSKSSPERDARSLVPLKITTAPLAGGRSDWRRSVREYIATYLQGKTLTNKDSQMAIRFNAESKAEAPSKLRNEPSFRAAHEIHGITEQAIHLGSVTPEKGRDQDTARFDYFALPVEIDGARSFAWFNTRQPLGGGENIFYEFGLFKPNKAARATQGPSANKQNLQPVAPQPEPELTVADFLTQIKDELPAFLKVASDKTPTASQTNVQNPTSFSIDSVAGSVVERRANDRVDVISIPDRVPSLKRSDAMHMLSARGEMSVVGFHLNADSGITYEVDGYTLSKTVVQPLKEGEPEGSHRVRIAAAYSLPEIIRKAIAIPVTDSKTERGASSVKDLFSAIRWNGNLYRVRIKGIESADGNHHARSLKIQDIIIENAPSNTEASEGAGFPESAAKANRDTIITVRQLFQAVNPYTGTSFSISGQVDHQKISSILNGTYEATTEDHLAARSFERSIRQSPQLLKEFGGHTPKARPISHLDRKECQIGAAIGSVFQKRVGLFDTGDVVGPGGRYSSELPDQIFFNSNKKSPFHLGVGHELWHSLTVQDHRAASRIESLIAENVDNGRLDGVLRKFEGAYGDHAVQEVAANIFGTILVDPRFWQELRTPYATEIANALKALPKNAAYDEANLIKDWPTFVKEVANLLRPKEQNPQQRSLLSDPSGTVEGNESGNPESSFSLSDDEANNSKERDLDVGTRANDILQSIISVPYPAQRLPQYDDLLPYYKWFLENLEGNTIPTPIGKNIVFKQGHFLKLIAGGKNKGFIPGATNWEEIVNLIESRAVRLDDPATAPQGFDLYRARNMPLLRDVLEAPHLILRSKDEPSRLIFLKKYKRDTEIWWQGVIADLSQDKGAIVSWRPRKKVSADWLKEHWLIEHK